MRIVTSGYTFMDIDAYGGCIAYAELLRAQDIEATAVSTAPLNESISQTIRSWQAPIETQYTSATQDTFTLIDLSDPAWCDTFVDLTRVDEVIDHHKGFEAYWQARIGDKARIEFIGAACTLIYEMWKDTGLLNQMSTISARLLICGILDNTLNFGAHITTQRDIDAYRALLSRADLPEDWAAQYFRECQQAILQDAAAAVRADTKELSFTHFAGKVHVGQLTAWDGQQILAEHRALSAKTMGEASDLWFINLINLSERKSYLLSNNPEIQKWLSHLLNIEFQDGIATADRLWLRKEIISQDLK